MRHTKHVVWITSLCAVLVIGCQRAVNIPQGRVSDTPMIVDEAMQIRDWDRSVAYYQNPRFIAGPTGFWYETPYYPPQWWYGATDTILFLGQIAGLPITLIITPPWTAVEYAGSTIEPTYHAMPPLPQAAPAEPDEPPAAPQPAEPSEPMEPAEPTEPVEPAVPPQEPIIEPSASEPPPAIETPPVPEAPPTTQPE